MPRIYKLIWGIVALVVTLLGMGGLVFHYSVDFETYQEQTSLVVTNPLFIVAMIVAAVIVVLLSTLLARLVQGSVRRLSLVIALCAALFGVAIAIWITVYPYRPIADQGTVLAIATHLYEGTPLEKKRSAM